MTKSFTVYPFPVVNAGPDKEVEGYSILLRVRHQGNDLEYLWTRDGNLTSNLYLNNNRILPTSTPVDEILYTPR